jgi:hypothetical protein
MKTNPFQRQGDTVVKNNRTNENDLRDAVKVKAQLAKQEAARSKVQEAEEEQREGGHPE